MIRCRQSPRFLGSDLLDIRQRIRLLFVMFRRPLGSPRSAWQDVQDFFIWNAPEVNIQSWQVNRDIHDTDWVGIPPIALEPSRVQGANFALNFGVEIWGEPEGFRVSLVRVIDHPMSEDLGLSSLGNPTGVLVFPVPGVPAVTPFWGVRPGEPQVVDVQDLGVRVGVGHDHFGADDP